MLHKKVKEFVLKHPNKYTTLEIAEHFFPSQGKQNCNKISGIITREAVRDIVVKEATGPRSLKEDTMKKTSKQISSEARLESQLSLAKHEKSDTERKYKTLQEELRRAEIARDQALQLTKRKPNVSKIVAQPHTKGEATAVVLASDWHVDEIVPRHKVNGLNQHDTDVSERRARRFFDLVVRFIRSERQDSTINNLVLWLGGDFFTSDAHGAPTAFPPMTAAMFAQDLLASGLKFLCEQEPNLKIHIVGSVGNHSRKDMMRPVNQALEQENSLEWMLYHSLKGMFESNNVKFQLDASYNSYVSVYNKVIRFNHGHLGWRYNDGLAGVHGPLWKVISQKWDKQVHADLTCCGHYHTYTPTGLARGYIVNGSNIGATPYSLNFGFEPPAQAFFLVHSDHGIVGQKALFTDT